MIPDVTMPVHPVMSAGRAKLETDREPTGFFPGSDRVGF